MLKYTPIQPLCRAPCTHPLGHSLRAFVGLGTLLAATAVWAAAPPTTAPGLSAAAPHAASAPKKAKPAAPVKLVDINSASRAELKKLPGVGDAEADKIIANRPFLSKAELVTKGVMPAGPYLSLKNRVVAMQKTMPKPAPAPTKP